MVELLAMSTPKEFVERFREAYIKYARGPVEILSPAGVVEAWAQLVDFVKEGYNDNIYEYHHDLGIRNLIELLLCDESLRDIDQMNWFRSDVEAVDERFKALLMPEPIPERAHWPWWQARYPRYAGPELANDIKHYYPAVEIR